MVRHPGVSYDGIAPPDLAARLRTPSCVAVARVTSTLDVIHELAAEGAPPRTLVLADEQVAGRGRQGRTWYSPAGRGIWLGYLVRPAQAVEGGVLSVRVGLALAGVLREFAVVDIGLKWPNDVLIGGRKVAGILCEARWMEDRLRWIGVGIGINMVGPLPSEVADQAVALCDVVPDVRRIDVLERLVPRLHGISVRKALSAAELDQFEKADWLAGREIAQPAVGTVRGIDCDGALLVTTAVGIERIFGGTVQCS